MVQESQTQIASMLKWIVIIIALTMAYRNCAPNFYFMRQGNHFYRGNVVTGKLEHLDDNVWVDSTESYLARTLRVERQTKKAKQDEAMAKRILQKELEDKYDIVPLS